MHTQECHKKTQLEAIIYMQSAYKVLKDEKKSKISSSAMGQRPSNDAFEFVLCWLSTGGVDPYEWFISSVRIS